MAWLRLYRGVHWLVEAHLRDVFKLWVLRAFGYG
jgi:hypothetical protein